jgi:hypothetical protein
VGIVPLLLFGLKARLTGTTTDTTSRNIKKNAEVKYPIRRDMSALKIFAFKTI